MNYDMESALNFKDGWELFALSLIPWTSSIIYPLAFVAALIVPFSILKG